MGIGTRYLNDTKTEGLGTTTNNGFAHTWKSSLYKLKCGMCNREHYKFYVTIFLFLFKQYGSSNTYTLSLC